MPTSTSSRHHAAAPALAMAERALGGREPARVALAAPQDTATGPGREERAPAARDRAALVSAIADQAQRVDAARARLIDQDHSEFLLQEYERERRVFRDLGHQLSRTIRVASSGSAAVAVHTKASAP